MKHLKPPLLAALLAISAAASAQSASGLKSYASLGLTGGGDVLVDGRYSNTGGRFTLRAGQGVLAMVGVQVPLAESWTAQAAVGYHHDRTNGDNWNFEFTRYPAELMMHHALNADWRVGLGARYSLQPKFKAVGTAAALGNSSLSASPGPVLEVQYMLYPVRPQAPGGGISLKIAQERFNLKDVKTLERSGQQIGLSLFTYF